MADSKISGLGELAETPASGDLLVVVDVSDTSMAASGTDKKIQYSNLVPSGGANPTMYFSPPIAVDSSWSLTVSNGSAAGSTGGMNLTTSATQNSYAKARYITDGGNYLFKGNKTFSCYQRFTSSGSDYQAFAGYGGGTITGTTITFTKREFGFKQIRSGGGSAAGYATNGDGTTETATSIGSIHYAYLCAVKSGTSSIKYYKDGTLVATHTTNIPDDSFDIDSVITLMICNSNVASDTQWLVIQACATTEMNFPY